MYATGRAGEMGRLECQGGTWKGRDAVKDGEGLRGNRKRRGIKEREKKDQILPPAPMGIEGGVGGGCEVGREEERGRNALHLVGGKRSSRRSTRRRVARDVTAANRDLGKSALANTANTRAT